MKRHLRTPATRPPCIALAAVALLLGRPEPLHAQSPEPFSGVDVSVAGAVSVSRDRLDDFWSVGEGGIVRVATPFYLGTVAVSLQRTPFVPRQPDLPRFHATTAAVDWGIGGGFGNRLHGSLGAQLGSVSFDLRQPGTGRAWRESELFVGARADVVARLAGGLGLTAAAIHQRIHTHVPIDLTFATVGLSYSLDAPGWLREFLR